MTAGPVVVTIDSGEIETSQRLRPSLADMIIVELATIPVERAEQLRIELRRAALCVELARLYPGAALVLAPIASGQVVAALRDCTTVRLLRLAGPGSTAATVRRVTYLLSACWVDGLSLLSPEGTRHAVSAGLRVELLDPCPNSLGMRRIQGDEQA